MAEPTIDEMLTWLKQTAMDSYEGDTREIIAIRAILEQHRDTPKNLENVLTGMLSREIQLEAIRAFVERVGWRANATTTGDLSDAITAELAAMEKESNAGTND